MGKYDLVETVFSEFGIEILFDKIAMKPGKPTVFGHRGNTYVFGLPGNPISTMVAFHMFVRPVILFLLKAENTSPKILEAKLKAVHGWWTLRKNPKRFELPERKRLWGCRHRP